MKDHQRTLKNGMKYNFYLMTGKDRLRLLFWIITFQKRKVYEWLRYTNIGMTGRAAMNMLKK